MNHLKSYYYLSSTPQFADSCAVMPADVASLLLNPSILSMCEPHKSSFTKDERIIQAKLLYLAHLHSEYGAIPAISALFFGRSLNVTMFDSMWTMVCVDDIDSLTEIEQALTDESVNMIKKTGHLNVDMWIDELHSRFAGR